MSERTIINPPLPPRVDDFIDRVPLKPFIDALLGSKDWCAPDSSIVAVLQAHPSAARYVTINKTTYHHEESKVWILWRKDSWESSYMEFQKRKVESEARTSYWEAHKILLAIVEERINEASNDSMPATVVEQMALAFIRAANFEAIKIINPTVEVSDLYSGLEAMNKLMHVKG